MTNPTLRVESRNYTVHMPSQSISLVSSITHEKNSLEIVIFYTHPTTGIVREVGRKPAKSSFSNTYFDKELDAYIVQEAMSDLMDNRHSYDWIE